MKILRTLALSSLDNDIISINAECSNKISPQLDLELGSQEDKSGVSQLISPKLIAGRLITHQLTIKGELNEEKILHLLKKNKPLQLQIGVDEAGRGPLLGSVMIGAVILPPEYTDELSEADLTDSSLLTNTPLSKLNDSKKISEKKRNEIYDVLPSVALGFISVEVPAKVIDDINILQASLQGMRVAVNGLLENMATLTTETSEALSQPLSAISISLLFDGNKLPTLDFDSYKIWGYDVDKFNASAEVKGDGRFASIASASIIAKVERDRKMYAMAKSYPKYGIENHKGYPTKAHFEALENFGVLPEHRQSFAPVRKIVEQAD